MRQKYMGFLLPNYIFVNLKYYVKICFFEHRIVKLIFIESVCNMNEYMFTVINLIYQFCNRIVLNCQTKFISITVPVIRTLLMYFFTLSMHEELVF